MYRNCSVSQALRLPSRQWPTKWGHAGWSGLQRMHLLFVVSYDNIAVGYGIRTPGREMDLIHERLKRLKEMLK